MTSPDHSVISAARPAQAARPRPAADELRQALMHMSAAERRLHSRDHGRPGELSHAQLRSIMALGRQSEMTVGQLAQSADLTPASVTGLLDQLEGAGIVARHRSTEDRRVCHVSLTPEGWELFERKRSAWQTKWDERLADVSDSDLLAAVRVIQQITELYDSVAAPGDSARSASR